MPNWNLAGKPTRDFQNALAMGMEMGTMARQAREKRELNNALAAYDPNNPETLKPIMAADQRLGIQLRGQQQQAAAQQQQQQRADIPMLAKLLETSTDEASWQRNRQIAQQYGIDISSAPPQFDPAWRNEQLMTLKALSTPEGQDAISTAGKVAMDMGYKPGTPEFNAQVKAIWTESQSKPYVVGGETRLYTPRIGQQNDMPMIASPGEAMSLPPGTQFRMPDGRIGTVPGGGGGGNVTSGFLAGL